MRYEYKILNTSDAHAELALNSLGRLGWSVVGFAYNQNRSANQLIYTLMREKNA